MLSYHRDSADRQEAWCLSETGRQLMRLEQSLINRLLQPRKGERLLDVGCGTGFHLSAFKRSGLQVTGIDPSKEMLDQAERRIGSRIGLFPGRAEDLPFEDNEFDLVTLINCMEYADDPMAALAEALRVARRRIFIGVTNQFSIAALGWKMQRLISNKAPRRPRHFSFWMVDNMVRLTCGKAPTQWGSVGLMPPGLASRVPWLESRPYLQKNPFGFFLGFTVDVMYTHRTDNLTVKSKLKVRTDPSLTPSGGAAIKFMRERSAAPRMEARI